MISPSWARECVRAATTHRFDPDSGWCVRCSKVRDDGRILNKGGDVLYEGTGVDPDWDADRDR